MTVDEKLKLIMQYLSVADSYIHSELISIENSIIRSPNTLPEDILRLYRAKVRYEAFKEFCADLEKIVYDNYGKM